MAEQLDYKVAFVKVSSSKSTVKGTTDCTKGVLTVPKEEITFAASMAE